MCENELKQGTSPGSCYLTPPPPSAMPHTTIHNSTPGYFSLFLPSHIRLWWVVIEEGEYVHMAGGSVFYPACMRKGKVISCVCPAV